MDPLSISVAVVGCLEAGLEASGALAKIIKQWKHATPRILALNNEVSDLLVVLDQTRQCQDFLISRADKSSATAYRSDDDFIQALGAQIRKAYVELEKLSQFATDIDRLGSIRKKSKWLFKNGEATMLQARLKEVRVRINDLLVTYNVTAVTRVELQLQAIHADVQRSNSYVMETMRSGPNNVILQSNSITINQEEADNIEVDDLDEYSHIRPRAIDIANGVKTPITESVSAEEALARPVQSNEPQPQSQAMSLMGISTSKARDYASAALRSSGNAMASGAIAPMFTNVSTIETIAALDPRTTPSVGLSMRHRRSRCLVDCTCACHDRPSSRTQLRSSFLGTLFVGFSGLPFQSTSCNRRTCHNYGKKTLDVTYMFPTAYLQYVLTIVLQFNATGGPQVGLVIRRRVPYALSNIFHAVLSGDMPLIERMVRAEPGCINDRLEIDGRSALQMTIAREGPIDLIEFLLCNGADPDQEDDFGRTPATLATEFVLSKHQTTKQLEYYSRKFPLEQHVDELGLSHLHKVIVGLCPGDAVRMLKTKSPTILASINERDESGRSALHRAINVGLPDVVEALLEAGADPDERFLDQSTPIHRALDTSDDKASDLMVESLLRHGADAFAVDHHGWSPILWGARRNRLNSVKLILAKGADVNARQTKDNHPPVIAVSCTANGGDVTAYLISQGADVNATDDDGTNALWDCIYYDAKPSMRALLKGGADYFHIWNVNDQTLLHFVAEMASVQMMEILAEHGLHGIDVGRRDKDGALAEELFEQRRNVNKELREAWRVLLWKIENGDPPQSVGGGGGGEDGADADAGDDTAGENNGAVGHSADADTGVIGSLDDSDEPDSPTFFATAPDMPPPYIVHGEVEEDDIWYEAVEEIICV